MVRSPRATLAICLLLSACAADEPIAEADPPDAAETVTPQEPDLAGGLFASSVDDIVMKESAGSVGALTAGAPDATPASTAKRPSSGTAGNEGRTITAAQVKKVVSAQTPQVRACYEKELKKQAGLSGKVVMSWTIGANGKVTGARVVRNTTRNSSMVPCMIRAVAGWTFPGAEAPFDVEYPFVFKPRDY